MPGSHAAPRPRTTPRRLVAFRRARAAAWSCARWLSHACRSRPGSVISGSAIASSAVPVPGQPSEETARLLALGVSHHHAPLEVRERLYLQDGQPAELAEALGEAVVL